MLRGGPRFLFPVFCFTTNVWLTRLLSLFSLLFFKMVAYFRTITALQRHFIHFVTTSMCNLHVNILRNHQLHQLPATEEPELAQSVKNI